MKLEFTTSFRLHQTVYRSRKTVDLSGSGLAEGGWVRTALSRAAERSEMRPVAPATVRALQLALVHLANVARWIEVSRLKPDRLTVEVISTAMSQVDECVFAIESISEGSQFRMAQQLRSILTKYAVSTGVPRIERIRVLYRPPRAWHRSHGRRLISDLVDPNADIPQPLGAMPHESYSDLRQRSADRVAATLASVEAAASDLLDRHDERVQKLVHALSQCRFEDKDLVRVREHISRLGADSNKETPKWIRQIPTEGLAAIYNRICMEARSIGASKSFRIHAYRIREINDWLEGQTGQRYGVDYAHIFLYERLGDQRVLLGCLLIIQRHTGWNVNSVLEMTADGVQRSERGGYLLQGFKTRTGGETPIVEIRPADATVIRAIRFLLERLEELKRLGWANVTEVRLWLSLAKARVGRHVPYVAWGHLLEEFCRTHSLPSFSFEQLRVEVLASRGLYGGGLEAARHTGGHASIGTTARYLDRLLLQRLNAASALEFERRLEASVRFRMGTEPVFDANKDLLYAIGDGTSCLDPSRPPDPAYLRHGVCDAQTCHSGEGCPNRRIVITQERLEEIVRTNLFYESSWRSLLNDNREKFVEHHMPAIIVNRCLMAVVGRSEYRKVLLDTVASIKVRHDEGTQQ